MKKVVSLILRIGISAGIIAYIFSRPDTNFSRVAATIKDIKVLWLITALLSYKAAILISSYRWQLLMKAQNIQVSYLHALGLNYLGCFFNNFMLSLTGGDIVKAYYASKLTSAKKAEAATIVFVDRFVGMAGLMVMGLIAALFGIGNQKIHSAVTVIFCAVFLFALAGGLAFNKTVARKFGKYIGRTGIKGTLKKIYDAAYFYKTKKKVLLLAFGFSILIWLCLILINFQLAKGLGVELSAGYYFIFVPVINIISSIPVTVAGWGLREQMYKQFFGSVGMDAGAAISLSVAYALTMLLWSLVGGVLYALRLPRLGDQEERNDRQRTA